MQTIIGSGGSIGLPLAKELPKYTDRVRLVSRHPKKVNPSDELFPIDVNVPAQIEEAVRGSEVVYVTIGFEYNIKTWQTVWPPFLEVVMDACKKHNSRLVFFDNVYMYAKSEIPHMTEESAIDPPSRKGEVRALLHEMIMRDVENQSLTALIARSADFYGPNTDKSVLGETVTKNLIKGKKAQVLGDMSKIHTYTYTPDAARATALLGNTLDAYNQVWHVHTTSNLLTTGQWIELIAKEVGVEPRVQKLPKWMFGLLGLFIPIMKELPEMLYQNEMDYVFDSSKFEKRFGIPATQPVEGIRAMVDYYKSRV